ncbi:MAG: enoyl-CoA hydratase/isomerase family protein [Paracoccaceae bacterium]
MSDIDIRIEGRAGRITLTRPQALNAVTWEMLRAIDHALDAWAQDDRVALVLIDAEGDRAFAAGGDIVDLYQTGMAGDYAYGRRFWAEEYQLNARIAEYPKPYVAMMHGFVMGGGVGISCHGSHRLVDESAQIAMPECGIGLVPDVGGSWLLARAPAGLGALVGLTGYRMGPADAILTGFADSFVPRAAWEGLIARLVATGDVDEIARVSETPPDGSLSEGSELARWFDQASVGALVTALESDGGEAADKQLKILRRQSPLSVACGLASINAARDMTLQEALAQEFRYVWRCMERGDFLEGIRAQVIDKDRNPTWRHGAAEDVSDAEVAAMLAPLGADELVI